MKTRISRCVRARAVSLLACVVAGNALPATACTVPVFAYALERWPAEPVNVLLFHREPLVGAAREFHDLLQAAPTAEPHEANVQVVAVDVNAPMDEAVSNVWQRHLTQALPLAVCLYPEGEREFWAGSPNAEVARRLLDSPARRSVARELLKGASGVWVLLETGDAARDAAALRALNTALAEAQQSLRIAEVDPADAERYMSRPPSALQIQFQVVRLNRKAPEEEFFVRMLENAFAPVPAEEPAAFVFFGRGRVAAVLHGERLAKEWILPICAFLTGICSCELKEMNPGVDLLFSAGWSHYIIGRYTLDESLPELVGVSALAAPVATSTSPAPAPPPAPPAPARTPLGRVLAGVMIALILVLAAASLVLRVRRGKQS